MTSEDEALLRKGLSQNVVVYDTAAELGVVTNGMLVLMAHYAGFVIERFVSSREALIPLWPYSVVPTMRQTYREMGGSLPFTKCDLLMAVGKNGEVLLGAF